MIIPVLCKKRDKKIEEDGVKGRSYKWTLLGLAALLGISGQTPRKDVQEIPTTQCTTNDIEVQEVQKESSKKIKERKSAARRAMENHSHTTMARKSAAKRSMEGD